MEFPASPGCTDLALAVLAELDVREPFVSRAFEAYWMHNLNLNDPGVVQSLIDPGSVDVNTMKQRVEPRLDEANQRAFDLGVIDAPGYVIGGEVWIGREHMPWIRERLVREQHLSRRSEGH